MANSNSHENNTLQYPQGFIPGLNYMPAAFPMPTNGELQLGGQTMMHPLQQLGAMPFFGQGGGQFLMPTNGMPVFLHPGFPGAMQMAQNQAPQLVRDGGSSSRTSTSQQSATASSSGQIDGTPSTFPGMFPNQLQFFSHLPQLYMQSTMHQLPSSNSGEQSMTGSVQQSVGGVDGSAAFGNSAVGFPEGFAGMPMPGFPIPVAFPGMAPGVTQLTAPAPAPAPTQKEDPTKGLKPPKRPLTPYMRFSKAMWTTVKSSYPDMTVCEIGATIGRLWRELTNEQKEKYNEDFMRDKTRYDEELQQYLKVTGLQASDLNKPSKKKKESAPSKSSASSHSSSTVRQQQQQQQQQQQALGQQQQTMPSMPPQQALMPPNQPPNGAGMMNSWQM